MTHTLLVSDLHLPAGPSPLREAFARFLAGPALAARALYILGDLFEVWIGDDAGLAEYTAEAACLRALTGAGVPVFFQHGNRDFLVDGEFAARTGVQLLPDPFRVELEGVPTVLSHGDLFCTDDAGYQRWRRFAHWGGAQALFRLLPQGLRQRIAGGVRSQSKAATKAKSAAIMDVNEGAVRAAFAAHGVPRLIHGHTHRPADHHYQLDGRGCVRHVLCDWRPGRMEALRVDREGVQRIAVDG
jgi:UDP-2,3-diacylglucosamine hydrolase